MSRGESLLSYSVLVADLLVLEIHHGRVFQLCCG